jgi:hypothetical protein
VEGTVNALLFDQAARVLSGNVDRRGVLGLFGAIVGASGAAMLRVYAVSAEKRQKGPGIKAEFSRLMAEKNNSRGRKKQSARQNLIARRRCANIASQYSSLCDSYCFNNYGFITEFYIACNNACHSCAGYIRACNGRTATSCVNGFDSVW